MNNQILLFSGILFALVLFIAWSLLNSKGYFLKLLFDMHVRYIGHIKEWTGLRDGRVYMVLFAQIAAALMLVVVIYFVLRNIFLVLLIGYFIFKAPLWVSNYKRKRRLNSIEYELPTALTVIASSLTAGVSLSIALQSYSKESNSPLASEFAHVIRLQKVGVDFETAIEEVGKRIDLVDFQLLVMTFRISKSVGGNLSETLMSLSNTIQQKLTIEGKIRSLTAQGKMQGWVMICLPALVGIALFFIQPAEMGLLLTTFYGKIVLFICLTMAYVGHKVIQKILAIDV
ncbi:type II secretion system F family protein [Collimonas pratensis]|uniref:Type II secretion system (T2SS), F family protein n=1 Tax=Collimonas pratensis TaxID=279113 RepID=A0A127Q534_9BURK|nr:type II secretion system F family protein [Collimonas pratensis]AMP05131.1 type II secretion system (T2SS), F family protein [Collimonas pratensis]AMP14809.1 type II secretion system (T2SS), F family protein [Collimonas pratensis]